MSKESHMKPSSPCNCTNLRRASRALTQFYDKLLEPSGLKVTQYSLLNHLERLGPLTMNELSQAIRLERTTLVRNLKLLQKMGSVKVSEEENSRARIVHLTESGQELLKAAVPYWVQAQKTVEEMFTLEEFSLLKKALQKIEAIEN